jgi:hypothetical protein
MIIICEKRGDGTDDNPIRPLTHATCWEVVEERETEFVIRIKE